MEVNLKKIGNGILVKINGVLQKSKCSSDNEFLKAVQLLTSTEKETLRFLMPNRATYRCVADDRQIIDLEYIEVNNELFFNNLTEAAEFLNKVNIL